MLANLLSLIEKSLVPVRYFVSRNSLNSLVIEMAQQVKYLLPSPMTEFHPYDPHDGRREPTSKRYPLTFYTVKHKYVVV